MLNKYSCILDKFVDEHDDDAQIENILETLDFDEIYDLFFCACENGYHVLNQDFR